jgi:hypothetical protein
LPYPRNFLSYFDNLIPTNPISCMLSRSAFVDYRSSTRTKYLLKIGLRRNAYLWYSAHNHSTQCFHEEANSSKWSKLKLSIKRYST